MTIPEIYDWPMAICPNKSILTAIQNTTPGTLINKAGFEDNSFIAGSRNQLTMEFNNIHEEHGNWLAWIVNNGTAGVYSVPILNNPQLARTVEIDSFINTYPTGIPFSTNQPFSTGYGFLANPTVNLVNPVLEGNTELVVDTTGFPKALTYGKVFGIGRVPYHVSAIDYEGNIATIRCKSPFRRDYEENSGITLRPKVMCKPRDIDKFKTLFQSAPHFQPGTIIMDEFIHELFI